jgi:F-type H+-transporting ATPase subunit a
MFPLKIIEDVSIPISLAFRLFGNILGGMIIMALIFNALGSASHKLHLPIPLLEAVIPLPANIFFDIFEPILQAFIFTMIYGV